MRHILVPFYQTTGKLLDRRESVVDYFILTYSRLGDSLLSNTMSHSKVLGGTMGHISWDDISTHLNPGAGKA